MTPRCLADVLGGARPAAGPRPRMTFAGWSFAPTRAGLSLVPPGGAAAGEVTIRERHPLVAVTALLAPEQPPEALVTREGEYAVVARQGERSVGVVTGDEWCLYIDGVARSVEAREAVHGAVRALAHGSRIGLGERRRRWYLYDPPRAFQGTARAQVTEWRRPGARLTVFPADHERATPSLHEQLAGVPNPTPDRPGRLHAVNLRPRRGLTRWLYVEADLARPRIVDVAVLHDGEHRYVLQLESGPATQAEARRELGAVIDSVVPLPRAPRPATEVMSHWI